MATNDIAAGELIGYYNLNFERSKHDGLSLRLALYEELDVPKNTSNITGKLEYKNTGEAFKANWTLEYTLNGNSRTTARSVTLAKKTAWTDVNDGAFEVYMWQVRSCLHNTDGTGSFLGSCTLKTDETTVLNKIYYRTVASVTTSGTLTPIDQSLPTITAAAVTADRYGGNAVLALGCSHPSYDMTASLTIEGMTREQALARNGLNYSLDRATVAVRFRGSDSSGAYKSEYIITPAGLSFSGSVPLYYTYDNPLASGGRYPYSLTVTAANGKTCTVSGVLAVPQKVTGMAFDDESLTLAIGDKATPEYSIIPSDAEVKSVTFESSDEDIATVSADGEITAIAEGTCVVTVTSDDKGSDGSSTYAAEITVTVVTDTDGFPSLAATDYLGVVEITRLSTACDWLADKLGKTTEMQEVICQGRAHPVTGIRLIMETIEANVAALTERPAVEISKQNNDWYELVNGWIADLNALYQSTKEA